MASAKAVAGHANEFAALGLWINRGHEFLWLLTVVLVPLAFLDRDYVVSEAIISYVEVPKIALLRTLVALMAALWAIEWGIQRLMPLKAVVEAKSAQPKLLAWGQGLKTWVKERPTRWLILAVWVFAGSTILTTVLSSSPGVSLWGEVPGQDGYSAYTVIAYVVLFGVIAAHLKTRAQLWRLLGAIVLMGVVVAGYGIFQHYGHDFLNLTEITGGGTRQVTVFMGNDIFAAAVMLMTITITLLAGTTILRDLSTADGGLRKWPLPWLITMVVASLWATALAVQLLGITFTFARGPWVGTIVAILSFLLLTLAFAGWRPFARAGVLLAMALALILAVLIWQGSISTLGSNPGLGVLAGLVGLGWVAAVLAPWRELSRAVLGLGFTVALVFAVILAIIWFRGGSGVSVAAPSSPPPPIDATVSQVAERFTSVKGQVQSGLGGRGTHWKVSWQLIKDRPWFDFDSLSLPWLRPVVGYGPDLFRYTYLLRSPPEGRDLLPLEPDHAHNFFIHQAVEQGMLGLFSSLGIFVAVFVIGGYQLLRQRQSLTMTHKLILAGVLAVIAGRFLEMNVGVARVSDLTILWVLLALFAALPTVMLSQQAGEITAAATEASRRTTRRRHRRTAAPVAAAGRYSWRVLWWLAIVAWIIGGLAVLTWMKSVNYVRAAVAEGDGVSQFRRGNWQAALGSFDRAIGLAPDVSPYHNNRGQVYLAYLINERKSPEESCSSQSELSYRDCLALRSQESHQMGVDQRPLYFRSRYFLANAAYNRNLPEDAARFYRETLALVPGSWAIRNELANVLIQAGRPQDALPILEESLAISKDNPVSDRALLIQGLAHRGLGDHESAVRSFERRIALSPTSAAAQESYSLVVQEYGSLGKLELVAVTYFRQGDIYKQLGKHEKSAQAFGQSADAYVKAGLLPSAADAALRQGLAYQSAGDVQKSVAVLARSVDLDPAGAPAREVSLHLAETYGDLINRQLRGDLNFPQEVVYRGLSELDKFARALRQSGDAYRRLRQPELGPSFLYQLAQAFRDEGRLTNAAQYFEESAQRYDGLGQGRPAANAFFQLGLAQQQLGSVKQAVQALERSAQSYELAGEPDLAGKSYARLGQIYQEMGETEKSALAFQKSGRLTSGSGKP